MIFDPTAWEENVLDVLVLTGEDDHSDELRLASDRRRRTDVPSDLEMAGIGRGDYCELDGVLGVVLGCFKRRRRVLSVLRYRQRFDDDNEQPGTPFLKRKISGAAE